MPRKKNFLVDIAKKAEITPAELAALIGVTPLYVKDGTYLKGNNSKYWLAGWFCLNILQGGHSGDGFKLEFMRRQSEIKAGLLGNE